MDHQFRINIDKTDNIEEVSGKKIFIQGLKEIGAYLKMISYEAAKQGYEFTFQGIPEPFWKSYRDNTWSSSGIRCFEWYIHRRKIPINQILVEMEAMGYETPTTTEFARAIEIKKEFDLLYQKTLSKHNTLIQDWPSIPHPDLEALIDCAYQLKFGIMEIKTILSKRILKYNIRNTKAINDILQERHPELHPPIFQGQQFRKLQSGSNFFLGCTIIKMPAERILDLLIIRGFNRYELNIGLIEAEQLKVLPIILKFVPEFHFPSAGPRTNLSALSISSMAPPENFVPTRSRIIEEYENNQNETMDTDSTECKEPENTTDHHQSGFPFYEGNENEDQEDEDEQDEGEQDEDEQDADEQNVDEDDEDEDDDSETTDSGTENNTSLLLA